MRRSWIYCCVAVSIMASSVALGAKPVVEVAVQPATGVAPEFAGDIENFGTLLRSALADGGIVDVVDRSEFGDLVKAREFSMASSPEEIPSGRDAASNYRIVAKVGAFEKTGVKRGFLSFEFRALAVARVVDVKTGISLVDAKSNIKQFFATGTDAAEALAQDLASQINAAVSGKLTAASTPQTGAQAEAGEITILRVKETGEIMLSDDQKALAVGDELTVFQQDKFEDPRHPGKMLVDETEVGKILVERTSPIGVFARAITPNANLAPLMIARKTGATSSAGARGRYAATTLGAGNKKIPVTGEKPTLAIGKFKYSNEFNLSQTAGRGGKAITSAGAGQGMAAMAGLLAGATAGAIVNDAKGAAFGGVVGALGGQTLDSGLRGDGSGAQPAKMPSDQEETAIEKESQVLREMVVTKAQKSGKFTVIERTRTDEIKGQMDNEMDGDYAELDLIERGRMKSAKYSAFGTITRFETDTKQSSGAIFGGSEVVTMKITMDLRLVDNTLGTIVASDQVTATIETGTSQRGVLGFGTASENQGAIGELLDNLAQNVVSKIVTTIWPIKVVAVNADERVVTVSAGETVVSVGDRLLVYARGEPVLDPDTGEVLGNEEMTVGEVMVYETQVRFSKCRIIKPVQQLEAIKVGQICRPLEVAGAGRAVQAPESKPKFTF